MLGTILPAVLGRRVASGVVIVAGSTVSTTLWCYLEKLVVGRCSCDDPFRRQPGGYAGTESGAVHTLAHAHASAGIVEPRKPVQEKSPAIAPWNKAGMIIWIWRSKTEM
jgi:hypothetical protein